MVCRSIDPVAFEVLRIHYLERGYELPEVELGQVLAS